MLVHTLLEQSCRNYPEKEALWFRGSWMIYREIEDQANRIGQFLVNEGLTRGDRVVLLLENSFAFVCAYFGILKAGGVVVGLNTEITAEDLEYLVVNSDAGFLFIDENRLHLFEAVRKNLAGLKRVVLNGVSDVPAGFAAVPLSLVLEKSSPEPPDVWVIDLDLAEIVYTSGSTGVPKGVMLTHLNLVSNMRSIVEYFSLTPEDRMMVILPFTYIYGKSLLLSHVMIGGSLVIDNRFTFPNSILETMRKTSVTGFAGVPSTYSILLSRSSLRKQEFPSLRYVSQAGGHMAVSLAKEVKEAFSPAELWVMYGATEAAPRLSYLHPSMLDAKLGSIGTPVPNVDLFVADEEGKPLATGEEGEIVARGSNIMKGYWKDPDGTAEVLKNGLYFTGDLGKADDDGYIFIVGRKKDIIKVKGFRVSAKEIEERLLELDGVIEAAVIGVPDPVLGEAVKAFVVLQEASSLDEQEVLRRLQPHLSAFKLPKQIEFRKELPKNKSGKIMKSLLSAAEAEGSKARQ
ncbi:AMP-binding protein [Marispirochaeta sp.]|uniref:class I adenylate-forming enzyme family protein n=1 Tax=Marispirochaeta sp. TaxID=2038653 RepID=UPI0029C61822|nr:AMP-binding protein [Marispirochaeta sp.]